MFMDKMAPGIRRLSVMDNDIDLIVFNMNQPGNIKRAVMGDVIGTKVEKGGKPQ